MKPPVSDDRKTPPDTASPERSATDEKLREERLKADQRLEERAIALQQSADEVVERARELADTVLEDARDRADAVSAQPSARSAHALSAARAFEDSAVMRQRADADDATEDERAEERLGSSRSLRREREQTDQRLHVERERSDHAVASRDDFLAIVSHDVRGILNGLAMSADLLVQLNAGSAAGDRSRLEAERITRLTKRMTRIVGDLLDVVSMESGKLSVTPVRQSAEKLLHETVELFQLSAEAAQIKLDVSASEPLLESRFDHDRVLQVLTNLVGNAMKFTSKGGTIALALVGAPGEVRFTIRDTGHGIPGDQLDTIFSRFSQLKQSDQRGLGLGLYIARCIVEAHGGTIWAESTLGSGSAFHFTLPDEQAIDSASSATT